MAQSGGPGWLLSQRDLIPTSTPCCLVEDSALLPSALSPPPPLLFPVTTCKLKTNLPPPPPHTQASGGPPTPPHPQPGPSCRRPRQSVIPLALLSALGPSGQIKPLSHTPRKAQGQMGQDKWCQIIDPLRPGLGRAPTAAPHMAVGGGKGAHGGGSQRATWKGDDTSRPPWGPELTQGRRGPLFHGWMTQLPHPLFDEIALSACLPLEPPWASRSDPELRPPPLPAGCQESRLRVQPTPMPHCPCKACGC